MNNEKYRKIFLENNWANNRFSPVKYKADYKKYNVELSMFDVFGNEVLGFFDYQLAGDNKHQFSTKHIPNGLYFFSFTKLFKIKAILATTSKN